MASALKPIVKLCDLNSLLCMGVNGKCGCEPDSMQALKYSRVRCYKGIRKFIIINIYAARFSNLSDKNSAS